MKSRKIIFYSVKFSYLYLFCFLRYFNFWTTRLNATDYYKKNLVGFKFFLLFSNFYGQIFRFSMIWATFSVYIAIIKEIGVNLAIFNPQKCFYPSRLQIRPLKNQAIPPWKIFGAIPPALSTRTLPTTGTGVIADIANLNFSDGVF